MAEEAAPKSPAPPDPTQNLDEAIAYALGEDPAAAPGAGYIEPNEAPPAADEKKADDEEGKPKPEPKQEEEEERDDAEPDETKEPVPLREWKALRHQRQKVREREAALEARMAQLDQRFADLESKTKEHSELSVLLAKDPVAAVRALGKLAGQRPDEVMEQIARKNLQDQEPSAILGAIESLREELKGEVNRIREENKVAAQQNAAAGVDAQLANMTLKVVENIEDYPFLAKIDRDEAKGAIRHAIRECAESGADVSLADIANFLDKKFEAQYESWSKAIASRGKPSTSDDDGGDAQPVTRGKTRKAALVDSDQAANTGARRRTKTARERNLEADELLRKVWGE